MPPLPWLRNPLFVVSRDWSQIPGGSRADLCDVCDDVMGDLLKGTEGLEALPCNWACLRVPPCVQMCEKVKAASVNSTHYPCIAAGYCDAVAEGEIDSVAECSVGPFFRCTPSRYCQRKRKGFRFSCDLRPGIGRWIGMRNAVGTHAAALADGLFSQPHCGEPGAGPYCIATPTGIGAVAEGIGHILSVIYGGWKTIASIESPGGDDDRQWLTFWLILTILLFVERYLARVVLSTFPLYYEAKLIMLLWLLFRDGADDVYRMLRRVVTKTVGGRLLKQKQLRADMEEMAILRRDCKEIVDTALREERESKRASLFRRKTQADLRKNLLLSGAPNAEIPPADDYEEEGDDAADDAAELEGNSVVDGIASVLLGETAASPRTLERASTEMTQNSASWKSVEDHLFIISKYLLTEKGTRALNATSLSSSAKGLLIERAAARISFQPRFVAVDIVGLVGGPESELPAMDSNGRSDAYVTCKLVTADGVAYPQRGTSTHTEFLNRRPQWNSSLELTLSGGSLDPNGMFRSAESAMGSKLLVQVFDADVGIWGWLLFGAKVAGIILALGWTGAYVTGFTDELSRMQVFMCLVAAVSTLIVLVLSFFAYVRWGSDDEQIGEALVPLNLAMDQRRHTLRLTLRQPTPKAGAEPHTHRNSSGSLGVVRVRVSMSER